MDLLYFVKYIIHFMAVKGHERQWQLAEPQPMVWAQTPQIHGWRDFAEALPDLWASGFKKQW
jgi:hypothetical protein